ncbi:MAG: response regulator transcription factor [Pyrinomonadaceae bacterium]
MQDRKRILCVEDNEDICFLLVTLMERSNMEAICVPTVSEALRLMEQEQFRLYIIDSQLPGISGLSMCEEIRKLDRQTPIIIYSGMAYETHKAAGMCAGANAYLVKPETTEIVPTVKRLLELTSFHTNSSSN